ncbi:AGE family epimerase/isomerase [Cohnella ginsengisoli]|uniref:Cellobiose 2-epimerase n=1 Tax=Cohnella ginsengisoli TaxID=425004 RepID=A0A9X4QP51_9BACL|nr:AGE family epimerase/isomerase [Cohnella ginsengisoli]MDG0793176.1 AGE family epimerase/isomerase [Cohnella ginsengisoli]
MSQQLTGARWQDELTVELKDNILGYWLNNTVDEKYFGYIGEIASSGEKLPEAHKGLVLHARIMWTFASAYRLYKDEKYLAASKRAYEALKTHFRDPEHGGLYWLIDIKGAAVSDKKQVYGQAFVIYALSEYVRVTGDQEALAWAEEIYRLLEKHAYDPVHLGYVEALARDWTETDELSLSGKDLNERKSMNTHLHVLEAYTNLYRVWKPEGLKAKLKELIEVHLDKIIDAKTDHFLLFFDDEWHSKAPHVSYGHDIEGSWLLWEAAEVLGDQSLLPRVKEAAVRMAKATLEQGVDEDGGLFNEYDGHHLDDSKDWWPQAEAMVGFLNAYQLSGEAKYLEASKHSWSFISNFVSDREGGEWHWQVTRAGEPVVSGNQPKVGQWKCPYHNSRACIEVLERLEHLKSEA